MRQEIIVSKSKYAKWAILVVIVLMLVGGVCGADTTYVAGGVISKDSTWVVSGSPYVVQGDIRILNGRLSVEPGVKIFFVDYESQAGWKNNSKQYLLKFKNQK